jgi:hypothetical protein
VKVLAAACLAIAAGAYVVLRWMFVGHWGGLWWLPTGVVASAAIAAAVWLLRVAVRREQSRSGD